jgi:Tfp pilus assembly protein PilO
MAVVWNQSSQFYRKYLYNFMLMYKNRQDLRVYLEIFLSLLTVIIFGVFAIKPTLVTIASLITQIHTKEETIAAMDQKISSLALAQQVYEQEKDRIKLLDTAVPDEALTQDYLKQVDGVASLNKVALDLLSVKNVVIVGPALPQAAQTTATDEDIPDPLPNNASDIEMTFGVTGAYQNLMNYLKDIENLRRPIAIDMVSFDTFASEGIQKLVLTIRGRLPFYPKDKVQTNP